MSLSDIQVGIWNIIGLMTGIPSGGTHFYVDPVNGSDSNAGTKDSPFATLYKAHSNMTAGKHDVCHLVSDGTTAGSARLSKALAQAVDSTATTGLLTWSKNCAHLVGESAPGCATNRARIAPPSGVYTEATFNSTSFVSVTGTGCVFANFEAFQGFSTGAAAQICWTDAGRNTYIGCNIAGMGDTASAVDTGSRSLLLTGSVGESTFYRCTIGLDTVARTVANASVEFAGGTPRNRFIECTFPFYVTGSGTGALAFITSLAGAMDRHQIIRSCSFLNASKSGAGTNAAYLATLAASSGGYLLFDGFTTMVGFTGYGSDATSRGQIYVNGAQPNNATGISVAPNA